MIPTLNEAGHIAQAIASARDLGAVFVLDSGSTDGTQQIARDAGATVVEHPFTTYADQKNWGLDHLPFTGAWILILDADERITPQLTDEIRTLVVGTPQADGYYVNRVLLFMGRAVRHGGLYPSWNLRLFRRGKARYERRSVHEHMICSGSTAYLRHELLHIRREPIDRYIAKHIQYADLESDEWVKWKLGQSQDARAGELFKDTLRVRQWLRREIWPRLPLRPMWRFLYMYFIRLGVLDGSAGWHLARLMSCYEYMIGLLYDEKLRQVRTGTRAAREVPPAVSGRSAGQETS